MLESETLTKVAKVGCLNGHNQHKQSRALFSTLWLDEVVHLHYDNRNGQTFVDVLVNTENIKGLLSHNV